MDRMLSGLWIGCGYGGEEKSPAPVMNQTMVFHPVGASHCSEILHFTHFGSLLSEKRQQLACVCFSIIIHSYECAAYTSSSYEVCTGLSLVAQKMFVSGPDSNDCIQNISGFSGPLFLLKENP